MYFQPRVWRFLTERFPEIAKDLLNTNIRAMSFDRFGYEDGDYEDNLWKRFTNPWLSYWKSLCYWTNKPVDTIGGLFGKGLVISAIFLCQPLLAISLNLWTLSGVVIKAVILIAVALAVLTLIPFTDIQIEKFKDE